MMMASIILAVLVLLAAMLFLSIGVIFRDDHSFRSQHIHQNARMKKDNIHCATSLDREEKKKQERKIDIKKL
jgi:hypothetical protein